MEGVKGVLTAADIPGKNRIGMTGAKDQRVLADDRVRFLGEAVAVVAATSPRLPRGRAGGPCRIRADRGGGTA